MDTLVQSFYKTPWLNDSDQGVVDKLFQLCTLEVEVARIFATQNESCIYEYPADCTKPKQPKQIGSLEFLCPVYISSTMFFLDSDYESD